MKILLSAYACEPNRGSEPGVGWNMAKTLARQQQVYVLTSATHRAGIEAEIDRSPDPNLHFIYVDPLNWVYDWSSAKPFRFDVNIHYYLWQIAAYRIARKLHRQAGFDLAHHVTYVRYYMPSFLSLLPIPFIWGPVGGAESAPGPFLQDFQLKHQLFETLRTMVRTMGEWDPFVRMTVRHSALIWATTEDTAVRLRKLGGQKVQVMSESSLHQAEINQFRMMPAPSQAPIRFISIGRLLHWKGFHLGIRAFAAANLPEAEYWVVGAGPEMEGLQQLAQSLKVAHQVKFFGNLRRDEAMLRLGESSALVHPSLHDSGGWVCLEAMAAGRPVICLDLGGPGAQVTDATAFKIAPTTPQRVVEQMAQAMQQLAHTPQQLQTMGHAGQRHIQTTYCWDQRETFLNQLYAQVSNLTADT
jgi:glycosyltransferase involved in cell wall biosynthesis